METASDIAKYIIHFFHDCEDLITNLKLQKLLYYVQGWHLGLYERAAFMEDFQAWVHGPVQFQVYNEYRQYKWNPISDYFPAPSFTDHLKNHINEVLEVYGTETGYALERRTHLEDPWIIARNGLPPDAECNTIITKESIREYFRKLANEQDQEKTNH